MRKKLCISVVLAVAAVAMVPRNSSAAVFVNISIAPPAIPVYTQPVAPGPDYIWTPGYWAWDPNVGDYYWVPGTWIAAPQPGYLWTPGYWAFTGGYYGWHPGFWGLHIGYYGGVNYGFGYFGHGFEGGYWNGGHFFYNTAYSHVNVTNVRNVYVHNVTVVNNVHTSFVGGSGLQGRPSPGEQAASRENHFQPTGAQVQSAAFARQDRSQFAAQNHGAPPAAALARPASSAAAFRQDAFAGRSGGTFSSEAQRRGNQPASQQGQFGNRGMVQNGPAQQSNRGGINTLQGQAQREQAQPRFQRQPGSESRPQPHDEPSRPAGGGHEGRPR